MNSVGHTNPYVPPSEAEAVVAKPLTELGTQERKRVTSELKRIHKLVSHFDVPNKDKSADKA